MVGRLSLLLCAASLLTACGSPGNGGVAASTDLELAARVDALNTAVSAWQSASTIAEAHAAAEAARNLVVGPDGPFYGDADGDGDVAGINSIGLLPGLGGEPGLAQNEPVNACVVAHVLGGAWDEPSTRWGDAVAAIDVWAPTNNTFPGLASHPQRIVGWATLTLATADLDTALEYAGHARLHTDITSQAIQACE